MEDEAELRGIVLKNLLIQISTAVSQKLTGLNKLAASLIHHSRLVCSK